MKTSDANGAKSMFRAAYTRELSSGDCHKERRIVRLRATSVCAIFATACCLLVTHALAQETPSAKVAGASNSATRSPSNDDIAKRLKELTDDSFVVRQAAASSLLSAGMAARGQLQTLADGPEPEA